MGRETIEASKLRGWTLFTTTPFIISQSHRPIRRARNLWLFECYPSKTRQSNTLSTSAHLEQVLGDTWFVLLPISLLSESHFDMKGHLCYKTTFLWICDQWGNSTIVSTAQSCYRFTTSQSSWWDHVFCLRLSSTWDKNGFFYFCCFLLVHFVLRKKKTTTLNQQSISTNFFSSITFSVPKGIVKWSLVLNIVKGTQAGLLPIKNKNNNKKKSKTKTRTKQNKTTHFLEKIKGSLKGTWTYTKGSKYLFNIPICCLHLFPSFSSILHR